MLLPGLRLQAPVTTSSPLSDLRVGWAGFWSRPWLWSYTTAGTVLVAAWLVGFQILGLLVTAQRYAGARDWGLIQAAYAAGLLTGSLVCLRWKPYRLLAIAIATSGALALPLIAMGSGLPLPVVLIAAVLAGIGLDIEVVTFTTAFQQHVSPTEQGRLSAFSGLGERLSIPFGCLVTALAAHSWTSHGLLLTCGGLIVAATLLNLCVPDVHRINRLPGDMASASGT
ncbi:hypothetical protein [Streptomyces sp. TLI_55]|uniref:hypothetical protein n=1 Tax=Streptomyces sp. TLI_55 TaxID=1938861 RepID=UPI000BE34DCF|nr:hypothetical protein [Streptomyces sp. TLI_55]